jgi:hypothetical protein
MARPVLAILIPTKRFLAVVSTQFGSTWTIDSAKKNFSLYGKLIQSWTFFLLLLKYLALVKPPTNGSSLFQLTLA